MNIPTVFTVGLNGGACMIVSGTTPTTVRQGPELPAANGRTLRPSAALSVPKFLRANEALTTTTGWRASLSSTVKSRPARSFRPSVSK